MNKYLIALAVSALTITSAAASGLSVTTSYRNDKVVNKEGVEVSTAYQVKDRYTVGANVFANDDKIISYGAFVGIPVETIKYVKFTPYVGVEAYKASGKDAGAVNLGTKAVVPMYKGFGLAADVKWVHGVGSVNHLEDVSYSVGITKQF